MKIPPKLNPCPSCGHKAILLPYREKTGTKYMPYCPFCEMEIDKLFETQEEAAVAWNERSDHERMD